MCSEDAKNHSESIYLTNFAVFLTDFRCFVSLIRINFAAELKT